MKILRYVLWSVVSFSALSDETDIVVIASSDSQIPALSRLEIRNIFMGGVDERGIVPVSLPPASQARVIFNTKVIGLTESRIQSYWSQMRFSGRHSPPMEVDDPKELMRIITDNNKMIAFLPSDMPLPDDVKIVYTTHNSSQ